MLVVIFGGVFWDLIAGGDELRVWARPGEGRLFILHESTVKATCNIPCDLLVVIRRMSRGCCTKVGCISVLTPLSGIANSLFDCIRRSEERL